MSASLPIVVKVPAQGVSFAESVHAGDFRMGLRKERFHKLLFVQRGRVELHLQDGQRHVLPGHSGTVFVIPAGYEHRIADTIPSVILLLCLGVDWPRCTAGMRELWRGLEQRTEKALELDGTTLAEWKRLWQRALAEQTGGRAGGMVLRDALAMQVLVALARQPERRLSDSTEERIRLVMRDLDETFFDRWTIDAAAKRAGLSRRHFTQCFHQLNGHTLVNYLNARRLNHAEQLLASGRHTVTGAVFSSGFEDLAHFYRLFKKRHGMAPGAWLIRSGVA